MSVREYIGARYVPMFADPIEWDNSLVYEPLTVVKYQGASYVSRREVPEGISLDNEDYWILWADFNAQLQHYIDVVNTFDGRIDDIEDALPIADFDSVNTIDKRFDAIEDALPIADFDNVNTVDARFDVIESKFPISTSDIDDAAITTAKINDEAITTAKIDDGAVTEAKLSASYKDKIKKAIIGNGIAATVEPIYRGDVLTFGQLQSVAVDGNDVYLGFRDGTNFTPCIKRCNKQNNTIVSTYSNANIGHANSMTYDPIRNLILVASGTIYALDKTLATFTQFISQPGNVTCIAFDHITETLWASTGLAEDSTITIYKMEKDESEFSEFATFTNVFGRQDIAVYDDVLFINDTRANCFIYSIDRENSSVTQIDNITFAKHDTANRWTFMEPEGMTIDSSGYFWLVFGNSAGVANADGTTTCNGFFCNIPFNGVGIRPGYQSLHNHEILYLDSTQQDSFYTGITNLKSLAQCRWCNLEFVRELQFNTDFTDVHKGWLPDKSIHITINSGKTVTINNTISVIGGYIQLRILGTLVFNAIGFEATNRAVVFALRNTGTLTINNSTTLVAFGVFPCIMLVMNRGNVSGTYNFGSTALTGNNTYMIGSQTGSY